MELELAEKQRDSKITAWFGKYSHRILAFIRSRISDLESAEDAAQDVWLQLTRQEDIDGIEQVGNWLFTAARNRVTDYYRKKKPLPFSFFKQDDANDDAEEEDEVDNFLFDLLSEQNLPDTLLESQEFWDELDRALALLPPEQREVFIAHELDNVSFKEMALKTGLPINTLLARKRYAVLRLRTYFEQWLE